MESSEITTAIGREGRGDQSWWVEQWMELINSYRYKKRLERAWSYAREGNVTSIRFDGRRVHGRVQGTGEEPYKVKLWLDVLNDEDWGISLASLIGQSMTLLKDGVEQARPFFEMPNFEEDAKQQIGSERVTARCTELLRLLEPNQVKKRLERLLAATKGEGDDINFLNRWNYDKEQKLAIASTIYAVAENKKRGQEDPF